LPRLTWHRGAGAGLLGAWGLAVAFGMLLLGAYAAVPGDPGAPPVCWPAGTAVPLDSRRPTLLIFVHPRCPCSRASLDELAMILDRCGDRTAAHALVFRPRRDRPDWVPSALEAALAHIPGLRHRPDRGGEEARRFGAATSGHVLLYDTRGGLIFSGGITPGRGEPGDSRGRAALLGQIMGPEGEGPRHPVFGCSLRGCERIDSG
jgi:hypothetical protein